MEGYFARPFPFEKFDFVLAPAFPFGGMEHPGRGLLQRGRASSSASGRRSRSGSAATATISTRSRTSGSAISSRCGGSTTSGSRKASRRTWRRRCRPTSTRVRTRGRRSTCGNKPPAYAVDATRGTTPALAGARESRSGQEQLRRDRLQQGAGGAEAARLSRRRPDAFQRGRAPLPRRARVRQRDVARPARRDRRRGRPIARRLGQGATSCGPACR